MWAGVGRLIKKRRAVNWIEIEPREEGLEEGAKKPFPHPLD